jgi:DNA modification methylase
MGTLYYGDNLDILRRYLKDETVDLVYLDPPFNSAQSYNAFFHEKDGTDAASQIQAFEDTWHWNQESERTYQDLVLQPGKVSEVMQAFRTFLGQNDMMAYLAMMAPRLVELHRVLRPTGSIYLHCDPTASAYLKLLLDAAFEPTAFKNEIIWPRTNAHNIASNHFSRIHDTILFYTKTDAYRWKHQYAEFSPQQLDRYAKDPETGRLVTGQDLTMTGNTQRNFVWRGTRPPPNRGWGLSLEGLEELWAQGLILKKKDGTPRLDGRKVFLDEKKGSPVTDIWSDIERIGNTSRERLPYPTQKPVALLERILNASTDKGDLVLDPFCGCGTTVDAAEKLGRKWIGIDITQLATSLIKNRLRDTYGDKIEIITVGEPVTPNEACILAEQDKFQFQWWALGLVGARPVEQKKGADRGIDGKILFRDDPRDPRPEQIIIQVKGGKTGVKDVRDLRGVLDREKAAIGVLISLQPPTREMVAEAVSTGFYEHKTNKQRYPRLQLRTVKELMEGKPIERPSNIAALDETFKKAPKAKEKGQHQHDLPI